jgi:hypothetical protein
MISNVLRAAVVAAAFVASSSAFASVNLIENGDFSSPSVGSGWGQWASIDGWSSANDAVEVGNSAIYGLSCANASCQNLEVNANTFGDVYQIVSGLTVGETYTLSYLYGGRSGGGTQDLAVYFGGALLGVDTGSIGEWTSYTYTFTATSTSEKLAFVSQVTDGLPSYGNEVANVSLSAVPELSTWAMMGVGFAGLAFAGYRTRRTSVAIS